MKCFNITVCIYSTCASSPFCFRLFVSSKLFVMLILMYAFIILALFKNCQMDFDADNVQRHELVHVLQGIALYELLSLFLYLGEVRL